MHRRGVAWLLAGAALLACPSAASGSIPAALETFSGAWPQGCPEVTIEQGTDPDPTVSGFATPGTCVIYVTPTFLAKSPSADLICAVVVHEYGHLLGLDHSSDESNVMFPSPLPPPACQPKDEPAAEATETAPPVNADAATVTMGYQQPTTTGNSRSSRSRSCSRRAKARPAKASSRTNTKTRKRTTRRTCRR